jgi:hypothetical protein
MVNIFHHASAFAVVDETAMQAFHHQWQVYGKLVDRS